MLITNSLNTQRAYRQAPPQATEVTLTSSSGSQASNSGKALWAGGVAAGGLALGAGMVFQDEVMAFGSSVHDSVKPVLDAVAPIFSGFVSGAMVGAATGVGYGAIATMGQHDSGPLFAVLGGAIGGMVVGGVTGGISAAFGATPFLAAPAVIMAGAAMSYANSRS